MCQGSCEDAAMVAAATESLFSSARWPNLLNDLKKALAEPGMQVAARGPDGKPRMPALPALLHALEMSL